MARSGGSFRIAPVPPGSFRVTAAAMGYRSVTRDVEVAGGARVELRFEMETRPVRMQGIEVSVLRPDLEPQAELDTEQVQLENPKDSGELLRASRASLSTRATTWPARGREGLTGNLSSGYDGNLNAAETTGHVSGRKGRISYWALGAWRQGDDYAAGDVYSATRNAVRTIRRDSDDTLLFEDLMWPDATITDAGGYGRVTRRFGDDVRLSGTARVDRVESGADTASDFFRQNTSASLEQQETNWSGAVTLGLDLSRNWRVSLGAGSAVRTADATERYSDRIPSTKAQTSAEFMGNPDLSPERSNQADLWIEGSYPGLAVQLNVFGRHMDDYITIEPTELTKRLPLSPPTVFRYVNGEAEFWGFEASADVGVSESLTLNASADYIRGRNLTRDRPVIGVAPVRGSLGARFEPAGGRFFVQGAVEGVAGQDRVAAELGEESTDGYVTADIKGGVRVYEGLQLRLGVQNLADEHYANHLNAKNPFTGDQIPEPGRVLYADLSWAFGPIR